MGTETPLRVYCKNCGAPAGFDIVNQTYRCPHCGTTSGIAEAHEGVAQWRAVNKQQTAAAAIAAVEQGAQPARFNCPSCGADVLFDALEASAGLLPLFLVHPAQV